MHKRMRWRDGATLLAFAWPGLALMVLLLPPGFWGLLAHELVVWTIVLYCLVFPVNTLLWWVCGTVWKKRAARGEPTPMNRRAALVGVSLTFLSPAVIYGVSRVMGHPLPYL